MEWVNDSQAGNRPSIRERYASAIGRRAEGR
jgi:hypothetical protein